MWGHYCNELNTYMDSHMDYDKHRTILLFSHRLHLQLQAATTLLSFRSLFSYGSAGRRHITQPFALYQDDLFL